MNKSRIRKALHFAISSIIIILMIATATMMILTLLPIAEPTAQAQLSRGGTDASNPTVRTLTVSPSKGSPGTGALWIYDKSATNWFRFDPTNVVIVQQILGSVYTNRTIKYTNGINVTNATLTFVNGMLVQP